MIRCVLQKHLNKTLCFLPWMLLSLCANAADKPNILSIWGDDIGWFNVSAYNRGMMA